MVPLRGDSPGHFALYHPMQRLSNEERARHVEAAKVVDLQKVLQSGFATAAVPGHGGCHGRVG